ncbi:MAG: hypothetical protein PSX81_03865 [bacterium]|nr:hypothetical protein [bacterium]
MKNGYVKTLAIGCLAILFYNGCKPKDCHEDGTCAEDYRRMPLGEAKDYLYALPGSYWIYKNSATGELDTQTCTGFLLDTVIERGTLKNTKHITVEYERINRVIYSSFNKSEFYDETGFYNPNAIRPLKTIMSRYLGARSNLVFFNPFVVGEKMASAASYTKCVSLDSILNINTDKFYMVVSFDIDIDFIGAMGEPPTSTIYYWGTNVGLIKKIDKIKNISWSLINYKIIK